MLFSGSCWRNVVAGKGLTRQKLANEVIQAAEDFRCNVMPLDSDIVEKTVACTC